MPEITEAASAAGRNMGAAFGAGMQRGVGKHLAKSADAMPGG